MAQNTTLSVPAGEWTQITNADATSITFQVSGNAIAYIAGTADATAPDGTGAWLWTDDTPITWEDDTTMRLEATSPTSTVGAIRYSPNQGELNTALADLFPGMSAARVWVFSTSNISVFVSHA